MEPVQEDVQEQGGCEVLPGTPLLFPEAGQEGAEGLEEKEGERGGGR